MTKSRMSWATAVLAASCAAACNSTAGSPIAAHPSSRPHGSVTSAPTPHLPTSTVPCSNRAVVSSWPMARRAALLVVAPALNFSPDTVAVAVDAGAGGILFLGDAPPPAHLASQLRTALARATQRPAPLVMVDQEGGGIQRLAGAVASLPWPRDMARVYPPSQVEAMAAGVGSQMRQLGVGADLAPILDIDGGLGPNAIDADGSRSFSSDPAVAARYGVAFLQGLRTGGVIPVVKHFPGLGSTVGNTDYGAARTLPLATLRTGGLGPFQAAIAAGAPAVMVADATVPGLSDGPASLSTNVINGLLRGTLGFHGLVLTDSLSAGAITAAGYDLPRAAVTAIGAGADQVLFGSTLTPAQTSLLSPQNVAKSIRQVVNAISGAAASGSLPESRLDDAVLHAITARGVDLCA